jgi:hypothetical protein
MNFIPEKIQYDAEHETYSVRVFYSAEGREAEVVIGATKAYLYELFKLPAERVLNTSLMNKWLKIAMKDLERELPKTNTGEVYHKMYTVIK